MYDAGKKKKLVVYWSRRDFRIDDNPALTSASLNAFKSGTAFMPLFVLENYMCGGGPKHQFGYPSRVFLSRALPHFAEVFKQFFIFRGEVVSVFKQLTKNFDIEVYVNEDVHPDFYRQIRKMRAEQITVHLFKDQLTIDRDTRTKTGNVYSVFTPFKNAVWESFITAPITKRVNHIACVPLSSDDCIHLPKTVIAEEASIFAEFTETRLVQTGEHCIDLSTLTLKGVFDSWYFTESDALMYFKTYLDAGYMDTYNAGRDFLEDDIAEKNMGAVVLHGKTSRMSLALTWGLVSARTLVHVLHEHQHKNKHHHLTLGASTFISELIWREFYKYLLYHNAALLTTEFQQRSQGTIAWVPDTEALKRFRLWVQGETGYPIVDAAMRQLNATGWMHNRARMVVASILTKNLGVDWRWGQEYFRASLIDLDEASNNGGWQWGASVGADPKPIRIFNPILQAKKYDASATYQTRWLGEERLRNPIPPIIPHAQARQEAISRYKALPLYFRRDQ